MEPSEYETIDKILQRLSIDFRAAAPIAEYVGEGFTEMDIAPIITKLRGQGLIETRRSGNINQYKLTAPKGLEAQKMGIANYINAENAVPDMLNQMRAELDELKAKQNKD